MKRIVLGMFILFFLGGCSVKEKNETKNGKDEKPVNAVQLKINPEKKYQKIESFGASGAWWSQDVGGWSEKYENSQLSKRDKIAELLFDTKKGIGLSSYRYNLGAGSADTSNSPKITDVWRRGESFETAPGVYDWTKDKNAQYMLKKAVNYGVEDIYLFSNSPLERLTKNGSAYGTEGAVEVSNLSSDKYPDFYQYLFDVTEHFLDEGIPVKYLSPINEPQWDWIGGQEGNHYTPEEVVAFSKGIYEAKESRKKLENVHLSIPELGEWNNSSLPYLQAMIADEKMMSYYPSWDIHSYWSTKTQKRETVEWLKQQGVQDIQLKMSEWTEMVNGKDMTMDSAFNLAEQIIEDLTILNVSDWQYWIAVSQYDYRDGLIYVNTENKEIEIPKRLWAMGNFSKFIRPGATRIEVKAVNSLFETVAVQNEDNDDEVVIVALNKGFSEKKINAPEGYKLKEAYVTSDTKDLEKSKATDKTGVSVPKKGIVTMIVEKINK